MKRRLPHALTIAPMALIVIAAAADTQYDTNRHQAVTETVPLPNAAPASEAFLVIGKIGANSANFSAPLPEKWAKALQDTDIPPVNRLVPAVPKSKPAPWRTKLLEDRNPELPWAVAVTDANGVIRRVQYFTGDEPGAALIRLARQWLAGRELYNVHCARCHGTGGGMTTYPNIISLKDMGEERTVTEILEASRSTAISGISGLHQDDQWAIAIYVAGL